MSEKMKAQAREILDQYLESNLHRKTPERYAILDAVFSMRGHFTLEELGAALERKNFRVNSVFSISSWKSSFPGVEIGGET